MVKSQRCSFKGCNKKPGKKFILTGFCGFHQQRSPLKTMKKNFQYSSWTSLESRKGKTVNEFNSKFFPLTAQIDFRCEPESKGISIDYFQIKDEQEAPIGYLKAEYITKDKFEKECPTPYHYHQSWLGKNIGAFEYIQTGKNPLDIKRITKVIPADFDYLKAQQMYPKVYTEKEILEKMKKDINIKKYPTVSFIKVKDNYRGQKLSDELYNLAVATYGGIFASGQQTYAAQRTWKRLSKRDDYCELLIDNGNIRRGLVSDFKILDSLWNEQIEETNFNLSNPALQID